MQGIQKNYDDLINAILLTAYEDIMHNIRRRDRQIQKARKAWSQPVLEKALMDAEICDSRIKWLEGWCRETIPAWRDIDPDKFIKWAHDEAHSNTRRKRSSSLIHYAFEWSVPGLRKWRQK